VEVREDFDFLFKERGKMRNSRTPGMAPPGTDFIIVYMPSPPELDESGL
jgi:hypothetical protein